MSDTTSCYRASESARCRFSWVVKCGEGRLSELRGLEEVSVDDVVQRGKRSGVLDVVKSGPHSNVHQAGDDERGELHLRVARIRSDSLRESDRYLIDEPW